ncbi:hypothetical protein [Mesoplasma photuris]|uniref:hypothetical protein n=1 Tax=Mesoplasma photuris TaxID=217731 RepID=UPI000A9F2193|nr:hypothetical protein [Mesoplasma photuris]
MKQNSITKIEDKYYVNKHQYFLIDKKEIKSKMSKIAFPAIIMDTEFFNRSHDHNEMNKQLYSEEDHDIVYVLQYSFAQNFREIYTRNNRKSIKSMTMRRNYNDNHYNFMKQYDMTIKSFINMCINKGIKTLVFAGDANDAKILKTWINRNKQLLNNKKSELFILNEETHEYDVNTYDIYDVLNRNMSFSNFDKNGKQFYDPKNLKPGRMGENTLSLPSLKKFFDYMRTLSKNENFKEDEDIYKLCISALKFYSYDVATLEQHNAWNKDVKMAKVHCYNDVLKLLYLIDFLYAFMFFSDDKNKYIKNEKKAAPKPRAKKPKNVETKNTLTSTVKTKKNVKDFSTK